MKSHVIGQRVQHGAVLLRGAHLALSQQRSQVVDVADEGGEFGVGCDQRGEKTSREEDAMGLRGNY